LSRSFRTALTIAQLPSHYAIRRLTAIGGKFLEP
jgi:hypothetical protein